MGSRLAIALMWACLLGAATTAIVVNATLQSPRTQRLVQAADVTHLGAITLPEGVGNPNSLAVDGATLYVGCYFGAGKTGIASVTLPAIGGTAALVTPCSQLPNLAQVHRSGTYTDVIAGGILPHAGKILVAGWTYYDGSGGQVRSHWTGSATSHTGPFAMAVSDVPLNADRTGRMSMVGGYMGVVPPEWQALLGGVGLTGQCCIPIISRSSYGPSVSVFNPADVGVKSPIPSKMLIGYPDEHKGLGAWEASPPNPYYGGTDQLGSVGFPAGTRSVLFTGRHGDAFCYGPGTADKRLVGKVVPPFEYAYCYDPYDSLQGNHGPPYRPTMWAYDANHLIAVRNGKAKPWDVRPYAKWDLPGLPLDRPYYLRAGWYDQATGRYYVGDTSSPRIEVFKIGV